MQWSRHIKIRQETIKHPILSNFWIGSDSYTIGKRLFLGTTPTSTSTAVHIAYVVGSWLLVVVTYPAPMRLDAPKTCCQSLHGNLNITSLHQLVLDPAKLHNSIEVPVPRFSRIRQFVVKHNSFASLPCSKVSIETLFAFTALWNNSPSRPNRDLRSFGKAGLTFPSDIYMVCSNASGLFDRKSAFARLLSLNETSVEN